MKHRALLLSLVLLVPVPGADATIPLPAHPRPDFERAEWVNLNGDWAFRFDKENAGERERWFEAAPAGFPLRIRVPYPWGSKLSGVGDEADVAWNVMREYAGHGDEHAWKMHYKLVRWVERVDTYLVLVRGTAWWLSQVDRQGQWPRAGAPGLLLTCHWGAGHWLWRCLQSVGVRA